jgi:hypothetical protein
MNEIDGTFAQRAKAILDVANDRLDHMVIAAGLDPAVDLRYGDWRGFDLSGADLRGFNFTGADLTGARFDNAFIAGAIFDQSIYDPTLLRKAADYEEFLRHTNLLGFDKRALLKNHWLFNGLSSRHIDHLAACSVGKSVPRAASIWAKGDPGSSLIAICEGTVKISVPSVDGHDAVLNLIGKGEILGEIALLDGRPRTADAVRRTTEQAIPIAIPSLPSVSGPTAPSTSDSGGGGLVNQQAHLHGRAHHRGDSMIDLQIDNPIPIPCAFVVA